MTDKPSDYVAHLDWEGLHSTQTYDGPFTNPAIVSGASQVCLLRDDDYNICGTVVGCVTDSDISHEERESMYSPITLKMSLHWADVTISRYLVKSINRSPALSPAGTAAHKVEAPFVAEGLSVQIKRPNDGVHSLREWYLNGPTVTEFMRGGIRRQRTSIYEHSRTERATVNDKYELLQYSKNSCGCVFVDAGSYSFWIESVPESFAPSWSKKLMIEYRSEWGRIPDTESRRRISELTGYLMGRELISIGNTSLTSDGYILAKECISHLRPDIRFICKDYPRYPIAIAESPAVFSEVLLRALSAYDRKHTTLPISECLRRYWLAVHQPPGLNIVILATTLELLTKAWYTSAESRSRGRYMSHDEYRELLNPEIDSLATKLESKPQGNAILRRILAAYNYGSNDHIENFFKELDINLTPEDVKVLRKRNKYVHGESIDYADARATWRRYSALFNIAMGRILEIT